MLLPTSILTPILLTALIVLAVVPSRKGVETAPSLPHPLTLQASDSRPYRGVPVDLVLVPFRLPMPGGSNACPWLTHHLCRYRLRICQRLLALRRRTKIYSIILLGPQKHPVLSTSHEWHSLLQALYQGERATILAVLELAQKELPNFQIYQVQPRVLGQTLQVVA